jgi:hypothetical protein
LDCFLWERILGFAKNWISKIFLANKFYKVNQLKNLSSNPKMSHHESTGASVKLRSQTFFSVPKSKVEEIAPRFSSPGRPKPNLETKTGDSMLNQANL